MELTEKSAGSSFTIMGGKFQQQYFFLNLSRKLIYAFNLKKCHRGCKLWIVKMAKRMESYNKSDNMIEVAMKLAAEDIFKLIIQHRK